MISKSAVRGGRVILESGAWPELGRLCGPGEEGWEESVQEMREAQPCPSQARLPAADSGVRAPVIRQGIRPGTS